MYGLVHTYIYTYLIYREHMTDKDDYKIRKHSHPINFYLNKIKK